LDVSCEHFTGDEWWQDILLAVLGRRGSSLFSLMIPWVKVVIMAEANR
jgi:hypothetical protein